MQRIKKKVSESLDANAAATREERNGLYAAERMIAEEIRERVYPSCVDCRYQRRDNASSVAPNNGCHLVAFNWQVHVGRTGSNFCYRSCIRARVRERAAFSVFKAPISAGRPKLCS